MPNYTPNLNLAKPLGTEAYDISVPNANADKLDTAFGGMEAGLEYYFAQNGSGTFTGLNNLVGYIHNVTHIGENMRVVFKNTTANTGNVTINISGIGAIPILRKDSTQIPPGGLKANTVYMIYFDGTNFLLLGDGGEYGTAAAPQVLQGYTIGTESGLVNGTIPTKNVQTFTPGTTNQTISSGQYLGGTQTILGDSDLIANNIKVGVNVFGVEGNFSRVLPGYGATSNDLRSFKSAYVNGEVVNGTLSTLAGGNTITPGRFNQTAVSGNSIVDNTISVAGSPNLIASNIKSGVNIFGVTGTLIEGKRVATGTYTPTSTTMSFVDGQGTNRSRFFILVGALDFIPSLIHVYSLEGTIYRHTTVVTSTNTIFVTSSVPSGDTSASSNGYSFQFKLQGNAYANSNGFRLPVDTFNLAHTWIAYE